MERSDFEETAPNQGAPGEAPTGVESEQAAAPPPTEGPINVGAPVNQGATAGGPEAPSEPSGDEAGGPPRHPELLVAAAFAGGFALAQILRRLGDR